MDWLSGLTPQQQGVAGTAFLIALGVLWAFRHFAGLKTGPEKPKVQEFYAAGQFADMGPVKELVENTGLLVQQLIRANIASEKTNVALEQYVKAKLEEMEERETEEEIERRARIKAEDIVREQEAEREERRRPPPRKPT